MLNNCYFSDYEGCGIKQVDGGYEVKFPDKQPYKVAMDSKLAANIRLEGNKITKGEYAKL